MRVTAAIRQRRIRNIDSQFKVTKNRHLFFLCKQIDFCCDVLNHEKPWVGTKEYMAYYDKLPRPWMPSFDDLPINTLLRLTIDNLNGNHNLLLRYPRLSSVELSRTLKNDLINVYGLNLSFVDSPNILDIEFWKNYEAKHHIEDILYECLEQLNAKIDELIKNQQPL